MALLHRIFAAVALLIVAFVIGGLIVFGRADTAKQKADSAAGKVVTVDRRSRETKAAAMANRRLIASVRRLERQNRRVLASLARVLVQARIAKRTRGGIRVTQAARGERGALGPRGLAGAAAAAVTAAQLVDALEPLLPAMIATFCGPSQCAGADGVNGADAPALTVTEVMAALEDLCGGDCKGEDAPAPTQDQVNAAVCAAGGCPPPPGPPGPQGETGPPGPPGAPAPQVPCAEQPPELGYACAPVVVP